VRYSYSPIRFGAIRDQNESIELDTSYHSAVERPSSKQKPILSSVVTLEKELPNHVALLKHVNYADILTICDSHSDSV